MTGIDPFFPVTTLYQGDTWSIPLVLTHYDSAQWVVTYVFRMAGQPAFTVESIPEADGRFLLAAAAATTSGRAPGRYTVTAILSNATTGERITASQTTVEVKPDITILANSDPRSLNRRALDDIEEALAAGAGSDLQEYTVAGTVMKKDRAGLLALRAHYLQRVRIEDGKPAIGTRLFYL